MAKILYFFGGANQSLLNDGTPNAAGSIEFFSPGTTDHVDTYPTYDDAVAGTNANANPVTLDAYGRADIWLVGGVKFQVYDADDVAVGDPVDDFNGEDTNTGTATADETNLLTNGSFEAWTNGAPDNITVAAYTGGEVTQDTSDADHGESSIKVVGNGSGGATLQWDDYFPVSELYEYLAEFLIKNATGTTNTVRVKWYDSAKSQLLGGDAYTDVYSNTTTHPDWTRKYAFLTPPESACFARFYAVAIDPSGVTSGTVRFDGCALIKSTKTVNNLDVDGTLNVDGTSTVATVQATENIVLTGNDETRYIDAGGGYFRNTPVTTPAATAIGLKPIAAISYQATGTSGAYQGAISSITHSVTGTYVINFNDDFTEMGSRPIFVAMYAGGANGFVCGNRTATGQYTVYVRTWDGAAYSLTDDDWTAVFYMTP